MQNVNLIRKNVILGLLTTISDSYLNQENSIVANNSISDKTSTIKKVNETLKIYLLTSKFPFSGDDIIAKFININTL